ncbi:MAG: dehydratase [Acidobacteria bacterium RIFCSPLOWO2_02_FULL_65_29]|nr:MAG: dehydratase [Acidobacteria bacterium RIFCSPLOWO2_02_FULL_65_29]
MIDIPDLSSLKDRIGQEIGVSDWIEITQERINQFADATDDQQWIHTDPARAAVESPFRTTIAHGFLTMSLVSVLVRRTFNLSRLRMAINYGLNKVRFVAPVPVGSRVRARFVPAAIEESGGGVQVIWNVTMEREGSDKPVCVLEWVVRYYVNRN